MLPPKNPDWSPAEDEILKATACLGRRNTQHTLRKAGYYRSIDAIGSRKRSLRITSRVAYCSWSEAHTIELRALYKFHSAKAIALHLSKMFGERYTGAIIQHRARELGFLKREADILWRPIEIQLVREMAARGTLDPQISAELRSRGFDRSSQAVSHVRKRRGIKSPKPKPPSQPRGPRNPFLKMDQRFRAAMLAAPECPLRYRGA